MIELHHGDCLDVMKGMGDNSVDAIVTDPPYGLSFMGKKWDYDVPSVEIWEECLRVLKPGGYLLSFAGTRTQHRMAVKIEDAGFEIRDMIAWVYGSGFPKSLNIGKAVDKLQGNEREVLGERKVPDQRSGGINSQRTAEMGVPTRMTTDTKGTSEWEGWGTALKPALEPITVARKPLSEKTVAENVLKWGTGGIDIDGGRVEGEMGKDRALSTPRRTDNNKYGQANETINPQSPLGRFPANLIHDGSDEVVGMFPSPHGAGKARGTGESKQTNDGGLFGVGNHEGNGVRFGDSGSAARFFYCAKTSKSERNRGCEEFNEVVGKRTQDGGDDTRGRPMPRNRNNHPTVKPVALMEYLVKLVSRSGATILDPFLGSGSTGIACKNLNRSFIGIEKEQDYFNIAKARIESASPSA